MKRKERKILWFVILVISSAIVIFNNALDLFAKLFNPLNWYVITALFLAIVASGVYWIHNRRDI